MVTRIKPRQAAKLREEFKAGFRIKMYSKKKEMMDEQGKYSTSAMELKQAYPPCGNNY